MSEFKYRTKDLAAELGIAEKTVRKRAAALGIGINLEGRAGFRYTEADYQRLVDALRPVVTVKKSRRRRAA